jgi:hypothetical protein
MAYGDCYGATGTANWNPDRRRKGVHADWDAHGAFMAAVYSINLDARIKTAVADLRSVEDFLAHYPEGGKYFDPSNNERYYLA